MNTLAARLQQARKLRGISQAELAKGAGISQPSIANIENGLNIRSRALPEIAAYLRISYQWLKSGVGDLNETSSPSVDGAIRMIPLRSITEFNDAESLINSPNEYLPCPASAGPDAFALKIEGDAMSPRYPDESVVFVDPAKRSPANGRRVLARLDGRAVVREYRVDGPDTYLMPVNPQYRPLPANDCEVIGEIIGTFIYE